MSQNAAIECEVKMKVPDRPAYERLASVLPTPRRWGLQLNVYLDTPDDALRKARVSLRIRITPDHARLTMKTPPAGHDSAGCDGAFVNAETEIAFSRDVAVQWMRCPEQASPWTYDGFGALAGLVGNSRLVVSTWSLTRRAICDTPAGVTLELDETVFSDGFRDFEIEAEHADASMARKVINDHAARAGLVLACQTRSKHARARLHHGGQAAPVPEGNPCSAMPPLFDSAAPTWLFCCASRSDD